MADERPGTDVTASRSAVVKMTPCVHITHVPQAGAAQRFHNRLF